MLAALDLRIGPTQEIIIAGRRDDQQTEQMVKLIRDAFLPNAVLLLHQTGDAGKEIEKVVPLTEGLLPIDGKATAYICESFVCKKPLTDVNDLKAALEAAVPKHKGDLPDDSPKANESTK